MHRDLITMDLTTATEEPQARSEKAFPISKKESVKITLHIVF